jgi:hypothetical protein
MQKYFYIFLLLLAFVQNLTAQTVTIPDANFKAKLIALGIDTNQDGDIQQAEALAVTNLNVFGSWIADLTGLEAFTNLTSLNCGWNNMSVLDLSALTNLEYLTCDTSSVTSLDASFCPNLKTLRFSCNWATSLNVNGLSVLDTLICFTNNLTSLDISTLSNIKHIDCYHNHLTSLNANNLTNLKTLLCDLNQISNLSLSGTTNLDSLSCSSNQLTTIGLTPCINLRSFSGSDNPLTSLDASTCTQLRDLYCNATQLSTLDVTNCPNLKNLQFINNNISNIDLSNNPNIVYLSTEGNNLSSINVSNMNDLLYFYCSDNQLTSLNVSGLPHLNELHCSGNLFTSIGLSNLPNLQYFTCINSLVTSLDFSDSPNFLRLECNNNSQLTSLFLKNGSNENILYFPNCPNLHYICADTNQFAVIQQKVAQYNLSNVVINDLCSFSLAGNINNISGKSIFDFNANGCNSTDSAYQFLGLSVFDGTNTAYTITNQSGDYAFSLNAGNYTITPQVQNPTYFSANSATINFPNNNNNVQTQDFCVTTNGNFPDVEITLVPLTPARPGFDADYELILHNKGTTISNGSIMLSFAGSNMTFISASTTPISQTANQLTWMYSNLPPLETSVISFKMNLLPPPTNNIGDSLAFSVSVPNASDYSPSDNFFTLNQNVIGAYDPNDKTCLEGKIVSPTKIGDYLHYLIRFQNTGNFYAENVIVVDSLDITKFDISSIQLLETSHAAKIKVQNNSLQFHFEGIMLQDSFTNEPASHGFVVFKIKTKDNLPVNTVVKNKAEIYFDYNLPVITNTETTTFASTTGIDYASQNLHFQCYPNPAQNILVVETEKANEFEIVNILGEKVCNFFVKGKENVDISHLPKGIYVIKEKTANGGLHFVKE